MVWSWVGRLFYGVSRSQQFLQFPCHAKLGKYEEKRLAMDDERQGSSCDAADCHTLTHAQRWCTSHKMAKWDLRSAVMAC